MNTQTYTGKCLCGSIHYEMCAKPEDMRGVTACHCKQCARWSGHYWASLHGPLTGFTISKGEELLKWYRSSKQARRGFCKNCGSALLWHGDGYPALKDQIDISAGSLDNLHKQLLIRHIFCAQKAQYYQLKDGVPIHDHFPKT